ncbi:50S ribosomal protein L21 [Candidatus Dependentiae bacterium]|nr:50S ribosomal protein L21 [Candidatus Dependentiae bacterium]
MERQDSFAKYSIVQIGAHQYQAIEGKTVAIEKIDGQAGDSVQFDQVLIRKDNQDIQIGAPFVKAAVKATIVKQMKGPKIVILRYKRRKKSRVKKGHRQPMTVIRFESI